MKLIAHRGNSSKAPENTIISFKKSVISGFKIIEFDVQLSKDNVPVIFHDKRLERTTNGKGYLKDYLWDELKKLDAGKWFGEKFIKEKIPSLDEILKLFLGKTHLQIEIKSNEEALSQIIVNSLEKNLWLKKYNQIPYCIPGFSITSFNINQVIKVKKIQPNINVGWLVDKNNNEKNLLENLLDNNINMYIPNVNSSFWNNAELKKSLKENNITICAWGSKKLNDVKKMLYSGADAMTVDWPEEAIKII
ncbi:MAG: hypothetical protein CL764_02670 [Chloroflexi bacterium]|nr:hypothetical protein [Chloroflexota bacterium]|tara:strand:+ start:1300 stop:2046 length:747 start_codon:yes stop_codon:yes gene_type:complete